MQRRHTNLEEFANPTATDRKRRMNVTCDLPRTGNYSCWAANLHKCVESRIRDDVCRAGAFCYPSNDFDSELNVSHERNMRGQTHYRVSWGVRARLECVFGRCPSFANIDQMEPSFVACFCFLRAASTAASPKQPWRL